MDPSTKLISEGFNQKSDTEIEKEIVEKKKKEINSRHKDYQRILGYFKEGLEDVPKKRETPKQTDPDKMNPAQLLTAGYDKLDEERKTEEKKYTNSVEQDPYVVTKEKKVDLDDIEENLSEISGQLEKYANQFKNEEETD